MIYGISTATSSASSKGTSSPVANYRYFETRHACSPVHALLTELFKSLYSPCFRPVTWEISNKSDLTWNLTQAITEVPVTLNQDMKALVPEIKEMCEYLFIASKHVAKAILFDVKESTHGTRRIESPVLKNWGIPITPLDEQQEIVRRVEALFKTAGELEARYLNATTHVNNLPQSILAKAFRGELVPQDPNDEPAWLLLDHSRTAKWHRGTDCAY